MRKICFLICAILLCSGGVCFEVPNGFSEHVLSNGMSVFIYEDFSTPITRVEYSAKAGVSMQSADNAGYFPLYAQLFSGAGKYLGQEPWRLESLQSECNADSARYIIEATETELNAIFEQLSVCAFAPIFGDADLQEKFSAEKTRVQEYAFSVESFINGSIDSRVFAAAPWKHDSGIYPALFENRSISQVRAVLMQIAQKYYSPQNSALFVSGPVKANDIVRLAQKTFGNYKAALALLPSEKALTVGKPQNSLVSGVWQAEENREQRKFVLSDFELSTDMVQVVAQYTSLSMEQADIAAVILDARSSALKRTLEENATLNIRGSEYINADAAHKNGSNRLILQTLLEKTKASAFEQSAAFEKTLKQEIADFTQNEFEAAKNFLRADFEKAISNSTGFMDLFSQFWAVDGIARAGASGVAGDRESLFQRFLMRGQNIQGENYEELKFILQNEEPWIFVLLNSQVYSPLAKKFSAADWQSVTAKNGSWYTQELYAEMKAASSVLDQESEVQIEAFSFNKEFAAQNKNAIQCTRLANGMRVSVKQNQNSSRAAVALYIKGADIENNYGMQEILASALCYNIQKAAVQRLQSARLDGMIYAECQTQDAGTTVTVECSCDDTSAALSCIGQALFYFETKPAEVDSFLAECRSSQIIKTGSLAYQLYSAGVKNFYKAPTYRALFSTKKEILEGVKYRDVMEASQKLLDANRLEIIASGNIDAASFFAECEQFFGALPCGEEQEKLYCEPKSGSRNSLRVKLEHKFLTDVSGDKAGPRPAVLIPTTDFSDPVQYWIKSPAASERNSALFDALLLGLCEICKNNIAQTERYQKMNARVEEKSALVPFGALTIFNVKSVADADALLEKSIAQLKEKIAGENPEDFLNEIKARYVKEFYKSAAQNSTAVKIMAKKINAARLAYQDFDARESFTQDYETVCFALPAEFAEVFENCFTQKPFKLYSADSKN